MSRCEHHFEHQGPVTWPSDWPLPGSGAHARIYADAYYCTRCCGLRLRNERELGNTYEKVRGGAVEYTNKPQELPPDAGVTTPREGQQ